MTHHDLYTDADPDRPDVICDSNGQVTLDLCKRCGKGEAELLDSPCVARTATANQHIDDDAVDHFAAAMKEKLAAARAKGRGGWHECDAGVLSGMLRHHVEKGDPRDVANFCMFLWSLGHGIAAAPTTEAAQSGVVEQERICAVLRSLAAWADPESQRGSHVELKRGQVRDDCLTAAAMISAGPIAQPTDEALLRQALGALEHHREQTRPIHRTTEAIAALRARLGPQPAIQHLPSDDSEGGLA